MADFENRELGWDDSIEHDSTFVLVPEGDYQFTVTKFERGRHNGSDKLPPCNKAIITMQITNGVDSTEIVENLFLHTKTEGILCSFFTAIGQRKHGEQLKPRWNEVIGSTGTCKIRIDKWKGNDGREYQSNKVAAYYEKGKQITMKAPVSPQIPQTAYKPGAF